MQIGMITDRHPATSSITLLASAARLELDTASEAAGR